jgi:hypothetical protein
MKQLKHIIEKGNYPITGERPRQRAFECIISRDEFRESFFDRMNKRYFFRDKEIHYVVDEYNQHTITHLYQYLFGSKRFPGNIFKGILLTGLIGSGKTIMMEVFLDILEQFSNKKIIRIHAKDLHSLIIENGLEYYRTRPMFIDDITKEPIQTNDYGTPVRPFEDLISTRYGQGGILFGTSNLKLEDMSYSKHTMDRMKEMFNVMVLTGPSRRK